MAEAPENGRPCRPDRSNLGVLRSETVFDPNMTTIEASTAVAVARLAVHGGGSEGGGAAVGVSLARTEVALQGALRSVHAPSVAVRGDSAVAEVGVLPSGPTGVAEEEVAVVGGSCGDAPSRDVHPRKERGTEKGSFVEAGSSTGAPVSSLSSSAAVARGAVAAVATVVVGAGKTLPKDGRASNTDEFRGERRREVVAQVPLWSQGERPAFVVVGLVGEVGERVLLLPTSRRRCETVGESPALSGEGRFYRRMLCDLLL